MSGSPRCVGRENEETRKANLVLDTTAKSKTEMLDQLVESHRKDLEAVFEEKRELQSKNEVRRLLTRTCPKAKPLKAQNNLDGFIFRCLSLFTEGKFD
jgi:tyrosyl-tRNA synthetase